MSLRTSLALIVTACLACPAAHGSPVNIDTFDLGSLNGYVFGPTTGSFSETIADTNQNFFGNRKVDIDASSASGDGTACFMVSGGRLAMGTNTFILPYAAGWTMEYYRGFGQDLINDDGVPNTGLLLEFLSAEYAYDVWVYAYYVFPNHSRRATISRTLPANPNPHQVFLPFSQFAITPLPDFGWNYVAEVRVEVLGAPDGDYELDRISANVPEPATMGLLALGALAVIRRRRSRRS